MRDRVARLEPGRLYAAKGLELIPAHPDAAAVEVISSGNFILVYFGPDKCLVELMADEADGDWQEELRRMLEATVAGERGAFNATGGRPDAKREERRFGPYVEGP